MKSILAFFLFMLVARANAQPEIGLRVGSNFGHLSFKNALGEKSETLKSKPGVFATLLLVKQINNQQERGKYRGFGSHRRPKNTFQHKVLLGVGFQTTIIEDLEITAPKKFNLSYTSASISYRFALPTRSVGLFAGAGVVYDYMTTGTQFNNGTPLDITSQVKRSNMSVMAETGFSYSLSASTSVTGRLSHNFGLSNLEKSEGQKAHLSGTEIGLGLYFRI